MLTQDEAPPAQPISAAEFRRDSADTIVKLLDRRLEKAPAHGRKFHVLSTVSDFETLALPVIRHLEEMAAATDDQAAYAALGAEYQQLLVQFDEDYVALHDSMLFS